MRGPNCPRAEPDRRAAAPRRRTPARQAPISRHRGFAVPGSPGRQESGRPERCNRRATRTRRVETALESMCRDPAWPRLPRRRIGPDRRRSLQQSLVWIRLGGVEKLKGGGKEERHRDDRSRTLLRVGCPCGWPPRRRGGKLCSVLRQGPPRGVPENQKNLQSLVAVGIDR